MITLQNTHSNRLSCFVTLKASIYPTMTQSQLVAVPRFDPLNTKFDSWPMKAIGEMNVMNGEKQFQAFGFVVDDQRLTSIDVKIEKYFTISLTLAGCSVGRLEEPQNKSAEIDNALIIWIAVD
jgi:hypothetical protein